MEEKLQEYARLLVEVGVNVQKGQNLVIACPVECSLVCPHVRQGGLCRRLPGGYHELAGRRPDPGAVPPRRG